MRCMFRAVRSLHVGCGALVLCCAAGCSSGSSGGAVSDAGVDTGSAATWTQVYTTAIVPECSPCHTTPTGIGVTTGNLDMTSQSTAYSNLVNVPAAGAQCSGRGTRVVPGQPGSSILYLKVSLDDPSPCGAKMPLGGPPLSREQTDLIKAWIQAGASSDSGGSAGPVPGYGISCNAAEPGAAREAARAGRWPWLLAVSLAALLLRRRSLRLS
jgi:hypothetical protein